MSNRGRWRLAAFFFVLFIYATLPVMPDVWRSLTARLGPQAAWIPWVLLALVWVGGIRLLRPALVHYPVLALTAAAHFTMVSWADLASEKIHVAQYGILGFLLVKCLDPGGGGLHKFCRAAGLAALIGILDEVIQWVLPNRYFDLHDIAVNILSSWVSAACAVWVWRGGIKKPLYIN